MKPGRLFIIWAVAVALAGCGDAAQGTTGHTASPTATPSATATPPATPSAGLTPGWRTAIDPAGAYSLQYPASWYQIWDSAFSNENAGYFPRTTPQVGTPANVFLEILYNTTVGGCPSTHDWVTASSDITLGGEPAKRYIIAMPPGYGNPDPSYRIIVQAVHKNHCWSLTFDSRTQTARDSNAALDDQIAASFRFLD